MVKLGELVTAGLILVGLASAPEPDPPPKPKRKRKPRPKAVKTEGKDIVSVPITAREILDSPVITNRAAAEVPDALHDSPPPRGTMYEAFHNQIILMRDVHERKNSDYSGDSDPLRNFRRAANYGVSPFLGTIIRTSDKWSRVESLVYKSLNSGLAPSVADEGLRDTLVDLANYCIIAIIVQSEEVSGIRLKPVDKGPGRSGHPAFYELTDEVAIDYSVQETRLSLSTTGDYEITKIKDLGINITPFQGLLIRLQYANVDLERAVKNNHEDVATIKPILLNICKYAILAACLMEAPVVAERKVEEARRV